MAYKVKKKGGGLIKDNLFMWAGALVAAYFLVVGGVKETITNVVVPEPSDTYVDPEDPRFEGRFNNGVNLDFTTKTQLVQN